MSAAEKVLCSILRILTPEEISELTSTSNSGAKVSLTDIIDQKMSGQQLDDGDGSTMAKVLPFKSTEEVESLEKLTAGENVCEYIDRFVARSEFKNKGIDEATGKTSDTSVFILAEKERFEYSQKKLKKKEVISLYAKNAKVDIEQFKQLKDDMSKDTEIGVLVNKRRY